MLNHSNLKYFSLNSEETTSVLQTKPLAELMDYELRSAEAHLVKFAQRGGITSRRAIYILKLWRRGKDLVAEVAGERGR